MRSFILPGRTAFVPVIGGLRRGLDSAGAVRAALAALMIQLLAGSAIAVPTITALEVRPTHFSPDGDGVQDSTEVLFTPVSAESTVTVDVSVVRDSDDVTVAMLLAGAVHDAGAELTVPWIPGAVAEGLYRFEVGITDGSGGDSASADVIVDTTDPTVDIRNLSKNPFDPLAGALLFNVVVTSDSLTSTVMHALQAGLVADTLGTRAGAGTFTATWDGNLMTGMNAASGRYELRAVSTDPAGNTAEDRQAVTVDRLPPTIEPDHPDTLQTTSFPVALAGNAFDEDRVAMVSASFDSGKTFVPADFMSAPGDSVQYTVDVTDPAPEPGARKVVLRAADSAGHLTTREILLRYDTFLPVPVSSRIIDDDGVVADGDSLLIESVWDVPGLSVRADFTDLDGGTAQQVTDEGGGRYLIRHRILPTNTRPAGTRRIVINGSTGVLVVPDTLEVTLADRHQGAPASVNRNRFDPLAGERVTIAGTSTTAAIKVEVYDLSGRRVRLLEGSGFVEWDGRNEERSDVASGVYLLRIRAGDAEDVRKVAVVRGGGQ
jgi:flagellar hook assembly protein FlgD